MGKRRFSYWSREQKKWFHRRDQVCQLCGDKRTEIHHIIPVSVAREIGLSFRELNSPVNGICLCRSCHKEVHSDGWESKCQKLLRKAIRNTKKFKMRFPKVRK